MDIMYEYVVIHIYVKIFGIFWNILTRKTIFHFFKPYKNMPWIKVIPVTCLATLNFAEIFLCEENSTTISGGWIRFNSWEDLDILEIQINVAIHTWAMHIWYQWYLIWSFSVKILYKIYSKCCEIITFRLYYNISIILF